MKIYDANNQELMTVRELRAEDGALLIRGKIFGAMPMVAKLTPQEVRAGLRLLNWRTMLFLLTMLLRK